MKRRTGRTHVVHDALEALADLADQVLDGHLDVLRARSSGVSAHPSPAAALELGERGTRRTSNVMKVVPAQCWPDMFILRRVTPSPFGMRRNETPAVSPALPDVRTAVVK